MVVEENVLILRNQQHQYPKLQQLDAITRDQFIQTTLMEDELTQITHPETLKSHAIIRPWQPLLQLLKDRIKIIIITTKIMKNQRLAIRLTTPSQLFGVKFSFSKGNIYSGSEMKGCMMDILTR